MTDIQNTDENLIPVSVTEIGGASTLTANARDLHQFLGVKRDFSTWIKKRLSDYKFTEGQDYLLAKTGERVGQCPQNVETENSIPPNGGIKIERGGDRHSIEYILELNTAKELAMVEKNEKGRLIRKYFIHCERLCSKYPKPPGRHRNGSQRPPQSRPISS